MRTIINWNNFQDKKPKESGEYLTVTKAGHIRALDYSKKYEAFNAWDTFDNAEHAIEIEYWATIPRSLKKIEAIHIEEIANKLREEASNEFS